MLSDLLRQFFVKHGIPPCAVMAAVSGGTDSTALLLALADLRDDGYSISAAHVNHHLRGDESDEDERFADSLASRLGIPFFRADAPLDSEIVRRHGIEGAARDLRYARLDELREQAGVRFVATAHQKNDQAETVLMRLVTGGGLGALRGIRAVREDGFLRPLLDVTREEIERFLAGRGIVPRFDRSNDDPRFLRNRIRPMVRELDAVAALAALAAQAEAIHPLLEKAVDTAEEDVAIVEESATRFTRWPKNPWLRQALLHRHIRRLDPSSRDVSSRDLERLTQDAATNRISVTASLELLHRGGEIILRQRIAEVAPFEVAIDESAPASLPSGGTVRLSRLAAVPRDRPLGGAKRQVLQVPGDGGLFMVRNRRDGDRFQPLGLSAPKKLKDLLIDRRIAAEARDRLPLLLWNGEIAWVAGVEVSERFKVTGTGGVLYEVWLEDAGDTHSEHQAGIHS